MGTHVELALHEFLEFSRTGRQNGEAREVCRFTGAMKLVFSRIFGGWLLPTGEERGGGFFGIARERSCLLGS